jgi:hypothetical protein
LYSEIGDCERKKRKLQRVCCRLYPFICWIIIKEGPGNFSGGRSPHWVNHVNLCLYCIVYLLCFDSAFVLFYCSTSCPVFLTSVGRLVVVIDVNPSHGFWTARLMKVFGHEGKCTCRYNTHGWIVYIMLFPVVCGTSRGSSWLRRNEFLKMTK